jgi:hypothetical protein
MELVEGSQLAVDSRIEKDLSAEEVACWVLGFHLDPFVEGISYIGDDSVHYCCINLKDVFD